MESKTCIKCGNDKPLKEFSKNKSKKDGHASKCKLCHKKYRREHYLKNKEKVIEQVYKYKYQNPEKYFQKNKNTKPNKKAGRTIESICDSPYCDNHIFISKEKVNSDSKSYCSNKCRKWNYHPISQYMIRIKKNAKIKGLDYDLDFVFLKNMFENIQNNKCAVTNVPLKFTETTTIFETPSLDRIDSSKGYTKDNVQWVMLGINYMKLNHSNDDLYKTLDLIKENYNK